MSSTATIDPPVNRRINANGINVRARPGTQMRNVSICDNTFEENVGVLGTQEAGIYVYDDTGNDGYEPIEVCASNVFTNLDYSVSGFEQAALNGTQPVVEITGGTIPGTEALNGFVIRLSDSAAFASIQAALTDPATLENDTILVPAGIYNENVVITQSGLTLRGAGHDSAIDGNGLVGSGIELPPGVTGVVIEDLSVRGFTQQQNEGHACISARAGNHGLRISGTRVHNCAGSGRGGIYVDGLGGIDDITIHDNIVHDIHSATGARGIVIWNGFKTNITITDNHVHDIPFCCGIELQQGSASGVTVTGNHVENVGDAGIGFVQLTAGAGPNQIADNHVEDTGRFGIELKIPKGSGVDTGDGAIVVENNTVIRPATPGSTDLRDIGGIVVIRRSYSALDDVDDVTHGVVVRGNTVQGWSQPSVNDGFGIVVEGTGMHVHDNMVSGSDIGVQLQVGNEGFPGDSDQNASNPFFSRGNAQETCVRLDENDLSDNGQDLRFVTDPPGLSMVTVAVNQTQGTGHCSIQAGIDAADAGDVIEVEPGTYVENIVVHRSVRLFGPFAGVPGSDPGRGADEAVLSPVNGRALVIHADDVVIDGFEFTGLDGALSPVTVAIGSGANFGGDGNHATVRNNRFMNLNSTAIYTNGPTNLVGWSVHDNLIDGVNGATVSGINLWKMEDAVIHDNVVRNIGFGGIQLVTGANIEVRDNHVENTGNNGINIGPGLDGGIVVRGNTVINANLSATADEAAITLYGQTHGVAVYCNTLDAGTLGYGAFSATDTFGPLGSDLAIYHNTLLGSPTLINDNSETLVLGSNWFGGAAPDMLGDVVLADLLTADPVGQALCGDRSPASIQAESGSGQSTQVGDDFDDPLVVVVHDALGGTVPAASVLFQSPGGAGAVLVPNPGQTDFNGRASVAATANEVAGSYQIAADIDAGPIGVPALFDLTNLSGAAASLVIVLGDGQSTTVGTAYAADLVVDVRDGNDNPVADGTVVQFTAVPAGNGASLATSPLMAMTVDGLAAVQVAANTINGSFQVIASAGGGVDAQFNLGSTPDVPAAINVLGGGFQSTEVGTAFDEPLVVEVFDQYGNPVADGTEVAFTAHPNINGASLSVPALADFTIAGEASVFVSANSIAGTYTVSAAADSVTTDFTLENFAGPAEALIVIDGDDQTAPAGTSVPIAPRVRVEDGQGNPVEGALVHFQVISGGGQVIGDTAPSDADGMAEAGSWTLGTAAGVNELTAEVLASIIAPVLFTATASGQIDVAVEVTSTDAYIRVGDVHDHLVLFTNLGVTDASAVHVQIPLPDEHDGTTSQWLCLPIAGAHCGSASSGFGGVDQLADLPAGSSIVFLTAAQVLDGPTELITFEAMAAADGDIDPGNDIDTATTQVVLYRDGFELGGDGSSGIDDAQAALGELRSGASMVVAAADPGSVGATPQVWLRAERADGSTAFVVDRLGIAGEVRVRIRVIGPAGERAGEWVRLIDALGVGLVRVDGADRLLIDTGDTSAELDLLPVGSGLVLYAVGD